MSMNHHPVHHDERATQHGRRLVAGPTVISIVIGMTQTDLGLKVLSTRRYSNIRHEKPVFHGDTIYAESNIRAREDLPGGESSLPSRLERGIKNGNMY
jgi:itaconyl-CoA hydratase